MTLVVKFVFKIEPYPKRTAQFTMRGGFGRAIKNKKTADFEANLKQMCANQYKSAALTGPLAVKVAFYLTKPKSVRREYPTVTPDTDNLLKSCFDAMNGLLWEDDCQIVNIEAAKRYSTSEGFIVLEVYSLAPQPTV